MAERSVLPVQDGAGTRGCTGLARAKAIYLTRGVLTICTGVGVTVLGLPCKWHTVLEIPPAAPISPVLSGEAEPWLQPDYRHRPTGLQESCSPRAGSNHKDLPGPSCKLISHAQPCCSPATHPADLPNWGKSPQNHQVKQVKLK